MRRRLRDGRDGRALVEELERMVEALGTAAEKSLGFLELGVVCEMLVPERQRALQFYRRAVELDAHNAEALDRGRMVCRELGRLDEFIRLCEIDLAHEPDEARREQLSARIGEALLNLGDRQRAAGFLVGAAGLFPSSLPIQDALGTVGYDDDWRSEVNRLAEIAEQAKPDIGARVSLRAARILRMQAPEDIRYEPLLLDVLGHDPYDESAHLLLDALYAEAGRWDDLEALEDQLVRAFPGADEQAALCQRFSFSWIARGQHDRAAAWCWRAIELGRVVYPIAGLTMLRGIYASRRQWDRLLEAIDALVATPLDEDAEVHIALLGGTIAWKAKNDLARAGVYFERVRRVAVDSLLLIDFDDALADQRNPELIGDAQRALIEEARRVAKSDAPGSSIDRTIDAWRRAIAADPAKRAPRRALARVLHRAERWRTLADALKDEEAHACRDDGERVALLLQLAALYRDRLHQDLLWTATLQRVVELSPGSLAALDQLEAAFAGMRRWSDVVATQQRKLAHVTDENERVELLLRTAAVFRDELGNEAEAIKATESALALDPKRSEVADWLEAAYARRREWDKLFVLKQKKATAISDGGARLAAWVELAQLATDKLKKPALATAAWSEVLALDGGHDAALTALERLYTGEQAWARLADIYARRAAEPRDMSMQLAYLQKLAQLCTTQLDDPKRAIDAWRRVLDLQPVHARAL
jgi:tetratricopeptide (TPR) repeat protein